MTSVFRKDRKESRDDSSGSGPTSPTPNDDSTVTSPTHNKERRGSAFSRLFSHKKQNDSTTQNESSKTTENNDSKSSSSSLKIKKTTTTVIESKETATSTKVPLRKTSNNESTLSLPNNNAAITASSESLYSENGENGEPTTRRTSRNKERIRNRKLAKREAAERHKSLPAGIGELEIDMEKGIAVPVANNDNNNDTKTVNGETNNKNSPSVTDATPRTRKKHRARRANTEFLGNVPLIAVQQASPMMSKDDDVVNRRAGGRRSRNNRAKTLTNGIDSADIFGPGGAAGQSNGDVSGAGDDGVVNENMSFAEIKKKLLEGLTDDKKIPEKVGCIFDFSIFSMIFLTILFFNKMIQNV